MRPLLILLVLLLPGTLAAQTRTRAKPAPKKPAAKKNEPPAFPRDRPPVVGDFGILVNNRARIVQVIDENAALAELEWVEVIGLDTRFYKELVWLNVSTERMVDGKVSQFGDQQFEVVGTKRYETPSGASKTVLEVSPRKKPEKP